MKGAKKKGGAKKPPGKSSFLDKQKEKHKLEKYGVIKKPTHFDLIPLRDVIKKFIACGPQVRSDLRTNIIDFHDQVRGIFVD